MGVDRQYADTRSAQKCGDGTVRIVIPTDIADELDIEDKDEVLWTAEEGEAKAEVHGPPDEE